MQSRETVVLEAAADLYNAVPKYLDNSVSKHEMRRYILDFIDSIDDIEFARSGTALYDIIDGAAPGTRKKAILNIEHDFHLTEREGHILRFLANERNPAYIAHVLDIAPSTAKAHKYSIFKKLGIHSSKELFEMLRTYSAGDTVTKEDA